MNLYNILTPDFRDPKSEVNVKTSVFIDTIYVACIYLREALFTSESVKLGHVR